MDATVIPFSHIKIYFNHYSDWLLWFIRCMWQLSRRYKWLPIQSLGISCKSCTKFSNDLIRLWSQVGFVDSRHSFIILYHEIMSTYDPNISQNAPLMVVYLTLKKFRSVYNRVKVQTKNLQRHGRKFVGGTWNKIPNGPIFERQMPGQCYLNLRMPWYDFCSNIPCV